MKNKIVIQKSDTGKVGIYPNGRRSILLSFNTPNGDGEILDKLLFDLKEGEQVTLTFPETCSFCGQTLPEET